MKNDPIVDRLRKTKRKIAQEFNYDIYKFAEYIKREQKKSGNRLVNSLKVVRGKSIDKVAVAHK